MNVYAPNPTEAAKLLSGLVLRRSETGPRPVDRPLVLYGAGKLGALAGELFRRLSIPVAYAMDHSPSVGGRLLGRIPVITPDAAGQADRESHLVAICIVNASYEPIRAQLAAMGWRHIFPIYDVLETYAAQLRTSNGWFAGRLGDEDLDKISATLSQWSDDWSRAAHLQFLAWRLHREEWQFRDAPVCIHDRYFIEPVQQAFHDEECFLDAGAYHGQVSAQWLNVVAGRFRAIRCVEADRNNGARLREWVSTLPHAMRRKIEVEECALSAQSGPRSFTHGMDLAARLVEQGGSPVKSCRLDDLAFPMTYGKIHLEGGELDALHGGLATLQHHRPMLAVTVYHNDDGLWRTPRFLMEVLPDYRYFMRLHAWCGTGCVVYAVPKERMRAA